MFDVVEWKCWGTYLFIQLKKNKSSIQKGFTNIYLIYFKIIYNFTSKKGLAGSSDASISS